MVGESPDPRSARPVPVGDAEAPARDFRCAACGLVGRTRAPEERAACPGCGVSLQATTIACPACAEPVPAGAERCGACGHRTTPAAAPAARPKYTAPLPLLVTGALPMALPFVGVLWFLPSWLAPRGVPIGGLFSFCFAFPGVKGPAAVAGSLLLSIAHLALGFGVQRGEPAALRRLAYLAGGLALLTIFVMPGARRPEHLVMLLLFHAPPLAAGWLLRGALRPENV